MKYDAYREAEHIAGILQIYDKTAVQYLATKLEIAYTEGQIFQTEQMRDETNEVFNKPST